MVPEIVPVTVCAAAGVFDSISAHSRTRIANKLCFDVDMEAPMSTSKQSLFAILVLLCALMLSNTPAAAQTVTGTISGTIVDPSGAVISGASVTLLDERTGDTRKATTNGEGRFVFSAVQPEVYTLRVEMQGFQ